MTYADQLAGLRALQRIQAFGPIEESTSVSADGTAMFLKVRSPLDVGAFQVQFQIFVLETFPGSKVEFVRSVFNVHLDPDAAADPLAQCEESESDREPAATVEATGYAALEGDDVDAARAEAEVAALRAAVERGVHVYVDSRTVVESWAVVEDRILTEARGLVESHEILEQGTKDATTYFVRIRARVKHAELRETVTELLSVQARLGRSIIVIYDWLSHTTDPEAPALPLGEPRVLRPTDAPAAGAAAAVERFFQSKKFSIHDAPALRRSLERMARSRAVGEDESAVLDLLRDEAPPVDLVVLVTAWSEGVRTQGDKSLALGRVQVEAWHVGLHQLVGTRSRNGSKWIAGSRENPSFELTTLVQETACQLVREFWPEFRASLEEERRFDVFLRNFDAVETTKAIRALEKVHGVRAVARNQVAPRFASLTVYGVGTLPHDRFTDDAEAALREALGKSPTVVFDRQTLVFGFDTFFEK